ncbi:hypothetical protein CEY11_10440 [Candidimonas nitroreducens]|uniref:ABC transporter domain-containing protein n=1 Tax=Candidimonas nitroreducens TaxID=683354 RepID=A0A225MFH1_9BURK|nr:hypothetical protein CEY11_10440 [Candidimonas nitroreducens]
MVNVPQVRLDNITKSFGATQIVRGVDIAIDRGEIIALLGPSGCGKTTLLRCIAGLEQPTGGEISIGPKKVFSSSEFINEPPEQRKIGLVFQSYALWPHMTVAQNVAYGLHLKKIRKSEAEAKVQKILSTVGLSGLSDRFPSTLSGGQQQRVAVARSLVVENDVILFDEPLSNLDLKLREEMRFELRQLINRLGLTAIFVTHDQSEAMVLADRICLMHGGKLLQTGTPRSVYDEPETRFAMNFLGAANFIDCSFVDDRTIRIPSGTILQIRGRKNQAPLVGIRPEKIRIEPEGSESPNALKGRITDSVFLGGTTLYRVEAEGLDLQVASPDPDHVKGSGIAVVLPPQFLLSLQEGA